ncbi:MAG: antitoxin family protein [Phycisphaerae bacterium]|nr:antitoxin family protein [Phycisphaerae bacterium]
MGRTINAIYEAGVLRPLQSLDGIAEHAQVRLTIENVEPAGNSLMDCIGILPDEDAEEIRRVVESEFEQVNPNEW